MKALALTELRKVEVIEIPMPRRTHDSDVLVKIAQVGVCGSDIHYFETGKIGARHVRFPFILGHECAGIVVEIGSNTVRVKPGDRVAVDPAISCGECDQCLNGRKHTCRKLSFMGCPDEAPGCLSEYIVMPEQCLYPIPATLTFTEGVVCEPLSIGIYAVKLANPQLHNHIGILGTGPIGLSVLNVLKQKGIKNLLTTDILEYRNSIAEKSGAIWSGNPLIESIEAKCSELYPLGLDVVFECAGQQAALDQAIHMLMPGGKLVIIGIPREEHITIPIDIVRRKEITIINVRRQNECLEEAIKTLAQKQFPLALFISHFFPFLNAQKAFEMVAKYDDNVMKAIIQFPH